jgi:hypothetical protein
LFFSNYTQGGGAVHVNTNGGSGKFTRVHFKDNTSEQGGGAVHIRSGGSGTFISCSWSGNSAVSVSDMFQIFSPFNNFLNNIIIVKFNLQNILSIYCLNFTMTF